MNKKMRNIIGLVGCLLLCLFGMVYDSGSLFVPILLCVTGFFGLVANIVSLKNYKAF